MTIGGGSTLTTSTGDAAYSKSEISFLWLVEAEKNLTGMNPDLCCLVHSPIIWGALPSLPKSISPSFPPSCSVPPSHMEIQRLINAATPLSLTALSPSFFLFHPSLPTSRIPFPLIVCLCLEARSDCSKSIPSPPPSTWYVGCAQPSTVLSLCWWMVIWHNIKISYSKRCQRRCLTQICVPIMNSSWMTVQAWIYHTVHVCVYLICITSFTSPVIPLIPQYCLCFQRSFFKYGYIINLGFFPFWFSHYGKNSA